MINQGGVNINGNEHLALDSRERGGSGHPLRLADGCDRARQHAVGPGRWLGAAPARDQPLIVPIFRAVDIVADFLGEANLDHGVGVCIHDDLASTVPS